MHQYTIFIFLFLTYFTEHNKVYVHSPHYKLLKSEVLFMAEQYSIVYMYHSFFIYLSVNGLLGCFHVLAIVNSATTNIGVHVSFSIFIS